LGDKTSGINRSGPLYRESPAMAQTSFFSYNFKDFFRLYNILIMLDYCICYLWLLHNCLSQFDIQRCCICTDKMFIYVFNVWMNTQCLIQILPKLHLENYLVYACRNKHESAWNIQYIEYLQLLKSFLNNIFSGRFLWKGANE